MNGKCEPVDFAISYAGEDIEKVRLLSDRLRQLRYRVFFADEQRPQLAGVDGEEFFERLFREAKQVIVFISRHYKAKEWPRFEWDVICERDRERRFIPIRLDDSSLKGFSSSVLYVSWSEMNLSDIADTCIKRLLSYERDAGIHRPSSYERTLDEIRHGSRGSVAKAYQLVIDNRSRTPLADAEMPIGSWSPSYHIEAVDWKNFSRVRRCVVNIRVGDDLERDELVFNLKHCCIKKFNDLKPDAIAVHAYSPSAELEGAPDVGMIDFAPFGDWGKAEDGLAYNLPTSEFDFALKLSSTSRQRGT